MAKTQKFVYQKSEATRLDVFLCAEIEELSRQRIQALIEEGHVWVDEAFAKKSGMTLRMGMVVTLHIPEIVPSLLAAEPISLDILYEDQYLLVLNKKAGLVTHPAPGHWEGTLVNALLYHCQGELSGIGGTARPGILHRLDRNTSGVMVVAKNDEVHKKIAMQFADHSIERVYHALVFGIPKPEGGHIEGMIGRHKKNRKKMMLYSEEESLKSGKPSYTKYKLLKSWAEGAVSLIECRPQTGRTHQIRVHLTAKGHPLLGDPVYGSGVPASFPKKLKSKIMFFKRQALHAVFLGFYHPVKKQFMRFDASPPQDFMMLQEVLEES